MGRNQLSKGILTHPRAGRLELLLNLRAPGQRAKVRDIVERELHQQGSGLTSVL